MAELSIVVAVLRSLLSHCVSQAPSGVVSPYLISRAESWISELGLDEGAEGRWMRAAQSLIDELESVDVAVLNSASVDMYSALFSSLVCVRNLAADAELGRLGRDYVDSELRRTVPVVVFTGVEREREGPGLMFSSLVDDLVAIAQSGSGEAWLVETDRSLPDGVAVRVDKALTTHGRPPGPGGPGDAGDGR